MCLSVVVTDSINSVVVIAVHCYCYCSCCVCLQHPGVGIDLRKRNIWDTYGPDVHLEVIINCEMLLIAFTHMHIHICRHAHTCMHTCMHAHAHTNMRMHKQMHTHTHTKHTHTHTHCLYLALSPNGDIYIVAQPGPALISTWAGHGLLHLNM